MRREHFTKDKAEIFARCSRFVGYLTEDELRRICDIMVAWIQTPPNLKEKGADKLI